MEKAQVVIQTAFLGDLILSIPFLQRVKQQNPSEKLILICKKGLGSFLKDEKVIDDFFEISKSNRKSYGEARHFLNTFEITTLFCVHRSIRSLLFASQIRAHKKIGFSSLLGFWIFDESFDYEDTWPDAIRKFKLLNFMDPVVKSAVAGTDFSGLNSANADGLMPPIPEIFSFSPPSSQTVRKRQVCLFPGSVWATKRWTIEGFTDAARALSEKGYEVLLLGGPDEKSLCEKIAQAVPKAKVLAGQLSIRQSIQVVAESELVIANDSAAAHMAAFKATPSVTIFGPTTLNLGFRPWSDQAVVVQTNLDCRPCGKHGHDRCPLGHHHCMKFISSETVIQKSLGRLRN